MTQESVVPIQPYKDETILSHNEPQSTPGQTAKRMMLYGSQDIDFIDDSRQPYKDETIISVN